MFVGSVRNIAINIGHYVAKFGVYSKDDRFYNRSGSFIGFIKNGNIYNRSGSFIGRFSKVPHSVVAIIYLYGFFSLQ